MPSARLLWMEDKREGFTPSVLSVEFNGKCMSQPGAKQAAKHDVGHSQDQPVHLAAEEKLCSKEQHFETAVLWHSFWWIAKHSKGPHI